MASALFITVRKTPVELPLVCHYYRTDGEEGLEKSTKQKRRSGRKREQREGGPSEEGKGKKEEGFSFFISIRAVYEFN